ncbi:MAG: hypothetical protein HY707_11525 [Ignavibacteriae bacterium]|nr:hypothetical protein [Ignavibacteriota bacterium]
MPPSNSVSHIRIEDSTIWIGTSKGLAKSTNGARTWVSYRREPAFANEGIFSVATNKETIWTSTGFEKELDEGSVQTGSGYAFSTNNGLSWQHVDQTLDQRGDSIISYGINDSIWILPVVVPEQNVTFDISLSPGAIWIASWASGLRKSTNNGLTWERILLPPDNRNSLKPTDTLWSYAPNDTLRQRRIFQRFDPRRNNNFLAFAVHAIDNDTIWCGTAGGVNKSTDGGVSWARFTRRNQAAPILSNWVIAIKEQLFQDKQRIWTTNWKTNLQEETGEEYGVSYTEDGGRTWKNLLHGIKAYDFAFKDSIAYIATDQGLYRTDDGGLSFSRNGTIINPTTRQMITTSAFFSVDVLGDTVWGGTGDGLVSTLDNASNQFGLAWIIHRTYQPVGTTNETYAYPNPFSPFFEPVRIHYSTQSSAGSSSGRTVSLEIFDFGMNRVRTLINNAQRSGNMEFDEIWDGRRDNGDQVANGVYFYRISIDEDEPRFGKILVLQ